MPTIYDRSPAFQADHDARHACLTLAGGLEALKRDARLTEGEQRYAWPQAGEMTYVESAGKRLKTGYETKIDAARLENVWLESLKQTAAVPFGASPTIDGWPRSMARFDKAVDDRGRDLLTYWQEVFLAKLLSGVDYTLIEMPETVGGYAYWARMPASQVADVSVGMDPRAEIGGEPRVRAVEAILRLSASLPMAPRSNPDEWPRAASESRVRVYRVAEMLRGQVDAEDRDIDAGNVPVHFREAARRETGNDIKWMWITPWTPLEARSGVFTEIPLVPFYASDCGPYRGRPPFADTASQQMALWRKTLDYDAREHRDSTHVPIIKGAKPGDVVFDGRAIYLGKDATAELLETTGAALEQLRKGRDEIKQAIRTGNLRPILSQPTPSRTATEIMVYELAASSLLEMWVLMDLSSLTQAMRMTAQLNGEDGTRGTVDIPHDFSLSPLAMEKIWSGYIESGGLLVPPELVWAEARRHQWISEGEDPGAIAAKVRSTVRGKEPESAPPASLAPELSAVPDLAP